VRRRAQTGHSGHFQGTSRAFVECHKGRHGNDLRRLGALRAENSYSRQLFGEKEQKSPRSRKRVP